MVQLKCKDWNFKSPVTCLYCQSLTLINSFLLQPNSKKTQRIPSLSSGATAVPHVASSVLTVLLLMFSFLLNLPSGSPFLPLGCQGQLPGPRKCFHRLPCSSKMLPLVYDFCVCRGDGATFCPLASLVAFEESSETATATLLKIICLFSSSSSFFFLTYFSLCYCCSSFFFYNVSRYGFLFIYGVCMYWVRVCMCVEAGEEMSSWKVLRKYVSKYSCPSLSLSP